MNARTRFGHLAIAALVAFSLSCLTVFSSGCARSQAAPVAPRQATFDAYSLSVPGYSVLNTPVGAKFNVTRNGIPLAGITGENFHLAFSVDTNGNVFGYIQTPAGPKAALWPAGLTAPILPGKGNGILGAFGGAYVIQTGNGNFGLLNGQVVTAVTSPFGTKSVPRGVSFDGTRLRGVIQHLLPKGPDTEAAWDSKGVYSALP